MLFSHVFPDVVHFIPQAWHSQLGICNYPCDNPNWSQCIAICVEFISRRRKKSYMYVCIDSGGKKFKTSGTHVKKIIYLASPPSIISWNFWWPGFWKSTNGISSHPKMDWPVKILPKGQLESNLILVLLWAWSIRTEEMLKLKFCSARVLVISRSWLIMLTRSHIFIFSIWGLARYCPHMVATRLHFLDIWKHIIFF